MPKVKALQYHTYDGKAYQAGDTYEAADEYLDTLVHAMKWAELADETATPATPAPAEKVAAPRTRK